MNVFASLMKTRIVIYTASNLIVWLVRKVTGYSLWFQNIWAGEVDETLDRMIQVNRLFLLACLPSSIAFVWNTLVCLRDLLDVGLIKKKKESD